MPGIFKQLNAQDIKITPFEAHKEYNTVDLGSIGASTESIAWSGVNKSEFTTGSKLYYQIDKLYYRNYIQGVGAFSFNGNTGELIIPTSDRGTWATEKNLLQS